MRKLLTVVLLAVAPCARTFAANLPNLPPASPFPDFTGSSLQAGLPTYQGKRLKTREIGMLAEVQDLLAADSSAPSDTVTQAPESPAARPQAAPGGTASGPTGSPAFSTLDLPTGPITISADELSGSILGGEQIEARGHAVVTRGSTTLRADQITYVISRRSFLALGSVRLINPLGIINAGSLSFDAETGSASGEGLDARIAGFSIRASHFEIRTAANGRIPQVIATQGAITSCTFNHPDYLLTAREIRLEPQQSLVVRHTTIFLFGARVITVPHVQFNLKPRAQSEAGPLIPTPGYSGTRGPFLAVSSAVSFGPGLSGSGTAVLSRSFGLSGGLTLRHLTTANLELDLERHQDEPRLNYPYLTIDRIPEVRQFVDRYRLLGPDSQVSLVTEAAAGYYHEFNTHTYSSRLLARGSLIWGPRRGTSHALFGVSVTEGFYFGRDYAIAGIEGGYQTRLDSQVVGSAALHFNGTAGHTPFVFDRLLAPATMDLNIDSPNSALGWSIHTTYDLGRRELYDASFSIAHTINCLRPSIGYEFRNREVLVGVTMPALEGLSPFTRRKGPASPMTFTWNEGDSSPMGR